MKMNHNRNAILGAFSGVISTLVFTGIHQIIISNLWFMLLPMLVAGALLSWSYGLLVTIPTQRSWQGYNLIYVLMICLLGLLSVMLFEAVTTMAAVVSLNGPPTALINQAMPMTVLFTLGIAVLITLLYGPSAQCFSGVLLTCAVLLALLGLNVSAIGGNPPQCSICIS
ncbi:MAG: hypothetical protein Kow0088_14270 [Anaerolineales bacterium]